MHASRNWGGVGWGGVIGWLSARVAYGGGWVVGWVVMALILTCYRPLVGWLCEWAVVMALTLTCYHPSGSLKTHAHRPQEARREYKHSSWH